MVFDLLEYIIADCSGSSYDGDDNVNKPSPQVVNPLTAEPPPATSPTELTEPEKDVKEETITDAPYPAFNQGPQLNGDEHNSNNVSGLGNGLTNHRDELPVEQDSYGTGIKEDG